MALTTRKSYASVVNMEEQFKVYSLSIDNKIEEQSRVIATRFEKNEKKFDEMMKMMREMSVNCST